MASKDADLADSFFNKLNTGLGIASTTDPVDRLRTLLIANLKSTRKVDAITIAARIVKGWNCSREGRKAAKDTVRWRRRGDAAEDFPQIK